MIGIRLASYKPILTWNIIVLEGSVHTRQRGSFTCTYPLFKILHSIFTIPNCLRIALYILYDSNHPRRCFSKGLNCNHTKWTTSSFCSCVQHHFFLNCKSSSKGEIYTKTQKTFTIHHENKEDNKSIRPSTYRLRWNQWIPKLDNFIFLYKK